MSSLQLAPSRERLEEDGCSGQLLVQGAWAGTATVRAGALVKNRFFVSCSPLGLLDTNLIAFRTRCVGVSTLYRGSLKVEMLNVQVKLSAPQGEAEYWDSLPIIWPMPGAGYIVRVCLNLSHLLQCGDFLTLPMWRITQLVSGFLTEGTDPGVAAHSVCPWQEENPGESYVTIRFRSQMFTNLNYLAFPV